MANQKIRTTPDRNIRVTGRTNGWQKASRPNQSDMNRGREIRAEPGNL
ncbi:hypothetical protein BDD14_1741 [Edaphobacter modestus]|uniref:Uncharacterized protein n=1 Tax=Edaphobacter modestus TaxID=388466 RepID=A0A4Q7YTQ9_9BACT|nr:hypothetical protein BDD14_1741 [Edaphobacter modestus]